ncbi:MAG: ArnT family glycosyltransferase [Bacteroidota bacterium]
MEARIEKYPVISLLLLSAGLYFFNLNLLQVTIMEARNFLVAREMLGDGNFLLTTMNGIPRYEKPPFPPWFTLPFAAISGGNELFWFRVPTSVFASLGILAMYFFLFQETGNRRFSLFGAMILSTTLYYLTIRFEGPSDTYAHVSMFGALALLFMFLRQPVPKPWLAVVAGLLTGISFLSKGPVSMYAMLLPFLIAYFLIYRVLAFRRKLGWLIGYLLISVIAGGSWYLYVRLMDPEGILAMASKEASNWTSYNVKPFYFYWNFFIQSGVWAIPALLSMVMYQWIRRVSPWFQLYRFSLVWMLLSVLLLSLIPEKKVRYLVPVMFPLAVTTAVWIFTVVSEGFPAGKKSRRWMKYLVFGLPAIPALLFPLVAFFLEIEGISEWSIYLTGCILFVASGVMILRLIARDKLVPAFYMTLVLAVLVTTFGFRAVNWLPVYEGYRPPENFSNEKNLAVFALEEIQPEVVWKLGMKVPVVGEEIVREYSQPFLLLVSRDHEKDYLKMITRGRSVEKVDSYDLNYFRKKNNRYRARYILDVYRFDQQLPDSGS